MNDTTIPLSVLFGDPERVLPSLSPDGNHMAWLAPVDPALQLHVDGIACTAQASPVTSYAWTADSRRLLWLGDDRGDEDHHVLSLDLATASVTDHTPFPGVRAQGLVTSTTVPDAVLVGLNRRDPRCFDLHRVDLDDGSCRLVAENHDVEDWLVDPDLALVGATRVRGDGRVDVLGVRDGVWRTVHADVGDDIAVLPLGVTRGRSLILRTDKDHTARKLARLDLTTGRLTTVLADPVYDVQSALLHPDTREPQLAVVERERGETVVIDEALADDLAALHLVHDGRPVVLSRDRADERWIVGYLSDQGPVAHYLWDRPARRAAFLFDHRPAMNDYPWSPMEPFTFTARDGLQIHGYVTFPRDRERTALPAVVNVHGGPWRRNVWGFDPEAQWLADRGAVCIQVNYRGSAGYGRAFLDAGDREWGERMQLDLVDAVAHLVATGAVDADRVGIMGTSYGGYAALSGVTFHPDVFACAVARSAPANLLTFLETLPPYWRPTVDLFRRRVGHPVHDRDLLWARSPLSRIDELRRPLLLVHGARDARVPLAESEAVIDALRRNGIAHEHLVFPDEGHGIQRADNRLAFYERAEAFFARHLGLAR